MRNILGNIKENKKVLTGAVAILAVVVILIIIIAVSCSKNDDVEKDTTKSNDNTTVAKVEKDTEEDTTEPDTEMSENETSTTEGSTEVAEIDTTEPPTTVNLAENITTNVNIQEPVTEESTTEEVTIKITAEVPSTASQEIQTPKPTEASTEKTTECAVLPGCENRKSSNIIYLGDEININVDTPFEADVCPYKLYDLNNLQTRKYTNGNGYYVTFVGYYGLQYTSDYDGSIDELEYNYVEQIVKSYGYNSVEDFEAAAEKLKTDTAATRGIAVGWYKNIPSTIDLILAERGEEGHGGGICFYGLEIIEY